MKLALLLVALFRVDPSILQEIRYQGSENFVGRPIRGYNKAACWLTRPAAEALKKVQLDAKKQGLALKVFDCYRPQQAVDDFVAWSKDLKDTKRKAQYYPDVPKEKILPEGYVATPSGHSRGSTLDLTLLKDGKELDMGTSWDLFDPKSHTKAKSVSATAQRNRRTLLALMEARAFVNFDKEWWHFTLKDEPYPDTYFNFPVD